MGNSFGTVFKITTWGESHGGGVGVVVDGCPPRVAISERDIQAELDRRRPGQSRVTSQRREPDRVEILSGLEGGLTTGTPILMMVRNKDQRPADYDAMRDLYRPSHADFTYDAKFGIRAVAGGGRASARETIGRVAAGAVARRILKAFHGVEIIGYVKRIQKLEAEVDPAKVRRRQVEASIVRCPDEAVANRMVRLIDRTRKQGDSLGGVVECVTRGVPLGLGEPVFDKLEADLAKAVMSLPASKGFEIGSGFAGTLMTGSQHNDRFVKRGGRIRTVTNHSGGVQGGISNGEQIILRVAFKPTATIATPQQTVDRRGRKAVIEGGGRHDPCVLPRAVPLVEAMVALVLLDHLLRQQVRGLPDVN